MSLLQNPFIVKNLQRILLVLVAWEMVRKGFALRGAGTKRKPIWFICLFVLNTLGILPIIYLIFFDKENKKGKK